MTTTGAKTANARADELAGIKERNARVEADKAWETSLTRRVAVAASTYVIMGIFLTMIGAPDPWSNALVPCGAYVLSTLTLPFLKSWWLKRIYKK